MTDETRDFLLLGAGLFICIWVENPLYSAFNIFYFVFLSKKDETHVFPEQSSLKKRELCLCPTQGLLP